MKLEARTNGGRLEVRLSDEAPVKLAPDLGAALGRITGERWVVSVSNAAGRPTLAQKAQAILETERAEVIQLPIMREILGAFPEAEILSIEKIHGETKKGS